MGQYYNEDRKNRYLAETFESEDLRESQSHNSLYYRTTVVLSQTAPFEEKVGKDIADFDEEDIKEFYVKCLSKLTDATTRSKIGILTDYINWCASNGYISLARAMVHPICCKIIRTKNNISRSKRIFDQYSAVKEEAENGINTDDDIDNFIFKTKENLFNYIEEVLPESKHLMIRACLYLMYYGFSNEKILSIRKDEVDDKAHTVCDVLIDNETAFKTIRNAKYAVAFESSYERTLPYCDTIYLIRTNRALGKVPAHYLKRIKGKIKEAIDSLPKTSKYKGIIISPVWLYKQHEFHRILTEKPNMKENEVVSVLKKTKEYDLHFADYLIMNAKAKDL